MRTKTPEKKSFYITGAHALCPTQKLNRTIDLIIADGKISIIGKPGELRLKAKAIKAEVLDAKGLFLSPGFIDLNCTIYEPGAEHVEGFCSGSSAAAAGGFTTILVKPNSDPVNDNAFMTDFILRRAQEHSSVRVIPMGAITSAKEGKKLAEIGSMAAAGVRAIGDGVGIADSYLMRKAMEYSRAFDLPIFCFPEDKTLSGLGVMQEGLNSNRLGLRGIPSAAEEIFVSRDIILARHTKAKLCFQSISTRGSLDLIGKAKEEGLEVYAETNPAYFMLNSDSISTYDANFKCFPPLRFSEDLEAVIAALSDGVLDFISTAHLPQTKSAKEQVFEHAAPGMIALETTFSLLMNLVRKKKISLLRSIELLSSSPAKLLSLDKELGAIREGFRADLVLFDPDQKFIFEEKKIRSASKNSPFLGAPMQGAITHTFVGGTLVFSSEEGAKI